MNRTDANTWLQAEIPPSAEPATPVGDYDKALDEVARRDSAGNEFFDYRALNAAAARIAGRKANASATFFIDGEAKIHDHWVARGQFYSSRTATGVVVKSRDTAAVKLLI